MKILLTISAIILAISVNISAQTNLVEIDGSGNLSYKSDDNGFTMPDFSHAGYRGGGIDIPNVAVVKEISAISGDNTSSIQKAIDEVGKLPLDANGIRGALLLKAGKYNVSGTLYVKYDGVILRGEGNGDSSANSTIIYATGDAPHQRDVIVLGNTSQNKWDSKISNTTKNITDNIVQVGATSFSVTSSSPFSVGDQIVIYHPCTQAWLQAVNYGGVPAPANGEEDERWIEGQLPIIYNRYITKIEGNKISIDAPVFYTLNKSLSQSYIYRFDNSSIKKEIGIENLRVDIESAGGENEDHAWQAIRFMSVENGWAKNVVTKGFGQSGFITDCTTRTTIQDCEAIDPVSIITGERRYNFNTYVFSQLVLFKDCYARNGRHHYISNGTSSASGNVFLNCVSDAVNSINEGHRYWTQGMLYDGHKEVNLKRTFVLGLYNRVDKGTGHGWSAIQSVLWNCDVTNNGIIGLQKPPTAQNYAIGCTAKSITGSPESATNFPLGYVERQNNPVHEIPSLYLAQLNARLKSTTSITLNEAISFKPFNLINSEKGKTYLCFSEDITDTKTINVYNIKGQKLTSVSTTLQEIEVYFPPSQGLYILQILIAEYNYLEKILI